MKKSISLSLLLLTLPFMDSNLNAQKYVSKNKSLSNKQSSIVRVSAQTAKGNLPELKAALNRGLDAGITINEIKEIFIQLSAYCGFPRSLNAINTFIAVSNERRAKGIIDSTGPEPVALSNVPDKYEIVKRNLERLTGHPESGAKTGYAAFVPAIEVFLKEHLFADIFSRGVLTNEDRELVTVSALTSLGGVSSQLQGHLSICIHLGFTESQLRQMLAIVHSDIGKTEADDGSEVLTKVMAAGAKTQ